MSGSTAVAEAEALGYFRGTVLDAVVSAGRASQGLLALRRVLPFVRRVSRAGEHTFFQAHFLTVKGGRVWKLETEGLQML